MFTFTKFLTSIIFWLSFINFNVKKVFNLFLLFSCKISISKFSICFFIWKIYKFQFINFCISSRDSYSYINKSYKYPPKKILSEICYFYFFPDRWCLKFYKIIQKKVVKLLTKGNLICIIVKKKEENIMIKFIKSLFSKKLDKNDLELLAICETHRS